MTFGEESWSTFGPDFRGPDSAGSDKNIYDVYLQRVYARLYQQRYRTSCVLRLDFGLVIADSRVVLGSVEKWTFLIVIRHNAVLRSNFIQALLTFVLYSCRLMMMKKKKH